MKQTNEIIYKLLEAEQEAARTDKRYTTEEVVSAMKAAARDQKLLDNEINSMLDEFEQEYEANDKVYTSEEILEAMRKIARNR